MKKVTMVLALLCVAAFAQQKGSFTDSRDGKRYKTVKIGMQTWMAENLNYDVESSVCYANKPANCKKYGRMYDWHNAIQICPNGWHLPGSEEWQELVDFAGGDKIAGKKLKAKSGWRNYDKKSGNGTNDYGFSVLPGGEFDESGNFRAIEFDGNFWNNSEFDRHQAFQQHFSSDENGTRAYQAAKALWFLNVRCLKD